MLLLAACQQPGGSGRIVGAGPDIAPAGASRAASGDVEAPEIFERTENGLWDGRPSLGGIWVAHPDVVSPERVLVQNQANGKSIVGALFRRERANPGPRIQISSDAAAELGILAGQPTMLRVVALKRREAATASAAAPGAASVAAGEAPVPAADDAAGSAAATGAALATTAEGVEPQPVPEDRPPTSLGRRRDRQATAAEPQAAAETQAAAAADAAALEPQPVPEDRPPTSLGGRRNRPTAATAATAPAAEDGDISVAPLDATAAGAAAPASGSVRFPFIQAAAFSSEANARAAVDRLRAAGVTAEIRRDGSVWRVLAGPVSSAAEQASVLEKVKGLGYSDAYPVRG